MRLAKLSVGAERYYLATVAAGAEDHQPPGLEPDGAWIGGGSPGLGLRGAVTALDLELILGGAHPGSRERLNRAQGRIKVVGYDLTFAAPKSVSILFGLADAAASATLGDAHCSAVEDALGYLEREAVSARRQEQGRRFSVATAGTVAAGFMHRTSRSADPHLHTHVLVANLVKGADGRWSAIDARGLYAHAVTAGYLYHARLRHELVQAHGLVFGPVVHGVANVAEVQPEVLDQFSQRRRQVEDQLQRWGTETARAAQVAALATRPAKDTSRSIDQLRDEWRGRAESVGLGQDRLSALLGQPSGPGEAELAHPDVGAGHASPEVDSDRVIAALVGRTGTFGRRDLLRALAQGLGTGADVASIERLGDQIVASGALVEQSAAGSDRWPGADLAPEAWRRRNGTKMVASGVVEARWTSTQHARALDGLVRVARQRAVSALPPAAAPKVPAEILEATIGRRPELTGPQAEAVRQMVRGTSGLDVLRAGPGPSGTDVVEAACEAWRLAGHRVLGYAATPAQALALESAVGLEPAVGTVALSRATLRGLPGDRPCPTVIVVAGAEGWDIGALTELVGSHTDAKLVVLIPDQGGPGSEVSRVLGGAITPITVPFGHYGGRANSSPAQVLRVPMGLESSVVVGCSGPALRGALVEDWLEVTGRGDRALMLGRDRAEVDALNAGARARLREDGKLTQILQAAGPELAVGDRVALRWGHAGFGLDPGQQLTVSGLSEQSDLVLRTDSGDLATVNRSELRPNQVVYAYAQSPEVAARTAATRVLVLGGSDVMERARPAPEDAGRDTPERGSISYYVLGLEPTALVSGARPDGRSRGRAPDQLADLAGPSPRMTEGAPSGTLQGRSMAELAQESDQLRAAILSGLPPDPTRAFRDLADERAAIELGRVNARALAPRLLQQWDLAAARADQRQANLEQAARERAEWLDGHRPDLIRYRELIEAGADRQALLGRAAEVVCPERLVELLGPRRDSPEERAIWREAAGAVEGFRERWGITDSLDALGREQTLGSSRARPALDAAQPARPNSPRRPLECSQVEQTVMRAQRQLLPERGLAGERHKEAGLERDSGRGLERNSGRGLERDISPSLGVSPCRQGRSLGPSS